jgi:excisionase family DNA binding protein
VTYETTTGDLPELISVADVANYLGLTPQTVISFIKRGDLVATKPPGMRGYRIPRQAFEDYLRAGYEAVQQEVNAEAS